MQARPISVGAWSIRNEDLHSQFVREDNCQRHLLPENLGLGRSNIFKLDSDLNFIETHFSPKQDLAVLSRMDNQGSRMVVTLALKGQSRFMASRGDEIVFKEGYTAITTFNCSEGARQYQGNKSVTQLRFSVSKSWLENNFGENKFSGVFNNNKDMQVISYRPISAPGIIAAQQLLHCNVAEPARPLFRQGQAMSLLASELSHLLIDNPQQPDRFTSRDRDIAHLAREILSKEFKNPPSVDELARRVGTNQFKLKQLFHHYFNNTPYGVLLEIRMEQSYQLLKTSLCPVNIVAELVGYNHASNFSAAFIKYFGFSPKQAARNNWAPRKTGHPREGGDPVF